MDFKILKNIINSSNPSIESLDKYQAQDFPVVKYTVIHELSKILTKLLSYKVSQQAYQRYSVRMHLIDTLRDWCRVKEGLNNLQFFKDNERSYNFFIYILKKYLSMEIIYHCDNVDDLVQLADILFNALIIKRSLMKCFVKVIERILSLDHTEKSGKFLSYVIDKSDEMKLDLSVIEHIYLCRKLEFIEKPLTDLFVTYCSDNRKSDLNNLDYVFETITHSALLFQVISKQLKKFFVETKYSQVAQDFIQEVLRKIEIKCIKYKKDILDLYPINLQYCIVLLRIKQSIHTVTSKNHTVQSLKEIFLEDHDNAIMLVSHFPEWLPEYLGFFEI